jgi:DNA-binding CsgD family transcriptional regulator
MVGWITLGERELRAVLDLSVDCAQAPAPGVGIAELLRDLTVLVRCDKVFWDWFSTEPQYSSRISVAGADQDDVYRQFDHADWQARLSEHPIMSGRFAPVTAVSDVLGPGEFRRTWLYRECFRPDGALHRLGLELPRLGGVRSVVVFSRGPGRDFDDRDKAVLRLLRPHVHAALQRLTGDVPRLTPRQVEIMRLVAEGLTNAQIARRLGTAEKTVGKHLENVYERLGAHSRVHAVALCEPLLDG